MTGHRHYLDENGDLKCAGCDLPPHKGLCDRAIRNHFKKYMRSVIVKDGSEINDHPKSNGRI